MEFLKQLSEIAGVPGREERVRELILNSTKGLWGQTYTDALGDLICRKKPGKTAAGKPAPKVLIACHIDEIGFYVRAIDDKGRLRLQNVGGFDARNLFARRVLVQGRRDVMGVLNPPGRPIHTASEDEKKKIPEVGEFFVDLFLPKKEVDKLVQVGDPVTLVQTLEEIGEVVNGKCLDNRVASWVAINAIRKVGDKSRYDIYYAATVQEEVGLRGAGPTAFGVEPDIAIAVDTTLACDTPGIDPVDAITQLGKGVGIKVMDGGAISDRGLVDEFVALAKKKKIAYQLEILPRGATDAAAMQRARASYRTITLSVPTRYIHTICESAHKKDLQAAVDLLAAWLSV